MSKPNLYSLARTLSHDRKPFHSFREKTSFKRPKVPIRCLCSHTVERPFAGSLRISYRAYTYIICTGWTHRIREKTRKSWVFGWSSEQVEVGGSLGQAWFRPTRWSGSCSRIYLHRGDEIIKLTGKSNILEHLFYYIFMATRYYISLSSQKFLSFFCMDISQFFLNVGGRVTDTISL